MNIRMVAAVLILASSGAFGSPADAPIRVAFVISPNFNMIDFAGPWEVFQDSAFELYTVAPSLDPVTSTGGAVVVPRYTFATAPRPDIVVIGAQSDNSAALLEWLRGQYSSNATVASVCTGARKLALSGLLDGKQATTHHDFIAQFRTDFPKVQWVASQRFVHSGDRLYSAGGLTSGIDLALHLVAQRRGQDVAKSVADYMEYRGQDWSKAD